MIRYEIVSKCVSMKLALKKTYTHLHLKIVINGKFTTPVSIKTEIHKQSNLDP